MHWMTAEQAAKRLGVKRRTLYTYASRGWIQTCKQGRTKQYRAADVEALRDRALAHQGHDARASMALDWGAPVLTTSISDHDVDGPYYRGVSALDLLDTPLHEVASRMWDIDVPPFPEVQVEPADTLLELAAKVLPLVEEDPITTGCAIVGTLLSASTLPERPDVHAAMVLCVDHGLNASTFAVRVAASTGASLPAVVVAGLMTLSGPRHGTASARILAELDEPPSPDAIGFAHPFYPDGDPRAEALLHRCPPRGALARRIEQMTRHGRPSLDVGLLAVCQAHGLHVSAATRMFAVGRSIGWIAHALEQRERPGLIRPRSRYVS